MWHRTSLTNRKYDTHYEGWFEVHPILFVHVARWLACYKDLPKESALADDSHLREYRSWVAAPLSAGCNDSSDDEINIVDVFGGDLMLALPART